MPQIGITDYNHDRYLYQRAVQAMWGLLALSIEMIVYFGRDFVHIAVSVCVFVTFSSEFIDSIHPFEDLQTGHIFVCLRNR